MSNRLKNKQLRVVCCAALLVTLFGCGPAVPKLGTVAVSGTVTYKGKAVEGASVAFVPVDAEKGKQAVGTTDSQGRFQLKTFLGGTVNADGAMPGDYKVSVVKASGNTGSSSAMPTEGQGGGPSAATLGDVNAAPDKSSKSEIPAKYSDATKSGLTATVKTSGNEPVALTLTDE